MSRASDERRFIELRDDILAMDGGAEAMCCLLFVMDAMLALRGERDETKMSAFLSEVACQLPWMLPFAVDLTGHFGRAKS